MVGKVTSITAQPSALGTAVAVAPCELVTVSTGAAEGTILKAAAALDRQIGRPKCLADRVSQGKLLDVAVGELGEEGVVAFGAEAL